MVLIQKKLKKYMIKKNLNVIKVSVEIAKGGWCSGMKMLQVEAIKDMENEKSFSKYEVDGIDVYIYNELELTDKVEIKYLYSIPMLGTVLTTTGIRIKD